MTQQEANTLLRSSLDKADAFFDSLNLNRKVSTSSLLVFTVMKHFNFQSIHFKHAVGNTAAILKMPNLWKGIPQMTETHESPKYLYKILSRTDWEKSQGSEKLRLPIADAQFIHLARKEQLESVLQKYWSSTSPHVVLKLDVSNLKGKLVLESNPGGRNKYYHLYDGEIPLASVVEVMKAPSDGDEL